MATKLITTNTTKLFKMEIIKSKLSPLGGMLAIFGLLSTLLYFLDFNLKLLIWIDNWGETIGWTIRIGLIIVGAALFFLARSSDHETDKGNTLGS